MPQNRYVPPLPTANSAIRLLCFPFAGGGSALYHRWRPLAPSRVAVLPVLLPGREGRLDERPHAEMRTLVREIADAADPWLDRPYALLGYSMGAWIAFELARELRRRGKSMPCLLIVAASPAPHQRHEERPLHRLPDAEFVAELGRRFDGIPPAVRENEELLQILLPAMRADIQLVETYDCEDEPPLAADIFAIGGTDDEAVSAAELADWRRHTVGRFAQRQLPGGHFFLFENERPGIPAGLGMIVEQLQRYITS